MAMFADIMSKDKFLTLLNDYGVIKNQDKINMAELSDAQLRRELKALGFKEIGPLTSGTRPLYIKKLNTLRKENLTTIPNRRLIGFSSDESEGELGKKAPRKSKCRNVKTNVSNRRNTTRSTPKHESKSSVKETTASRRSTRNSCLVSKKSKLWDKTDYKDFENEHFDASIASEAIHASLYKPDDSMHSNLSANLYSDDRFDSSESDDVPEGSPSRLNSVSSFVHTHNMSMNTSDWMNDSSLFNTSRDKSQSKKKEMGSASCKSGRNHCTPVEKSINRRVLRKSLRSDNINGCDIVGENTILEQGFQTVENPTSYKRAQCISKVLVVILLTFFIIVFSGYVYMRGVPMVPLLFWPLHQSSTSDQLECK